MPALGFTEAPRGEDVHWSMTGNNQKIFRWRRAATYANWPVLRYVLRGNTVSDAALIIGSLDPAIPAQTASPSWMCKKEGQTVPYKDFEQYGIDRKHSPRPEACGKAYENHEHSPEPRAAAQYGPATWAARHCAATAAMHMRNMFEEVASELS